MPAESFGFPPPPKEIEYETFKDSVDQLAANVLNFGAVALRQHLSDEVTPKVRRYNSTVREYKQILTELDHRREQLLDPGSRNAGLAIESAVRTAMMVGSRIRIEHEEAAKAILTDLTRLYDNKPTGKDWRKLNHLEGGNLTQITKATETNYNDMKKQLESEEAISDFERERKKLDNSLFNMKPVLSNNITTAFAQIPNIRYDNLKTVFSDTQWAKDSEGGGRRSDNLQKVDEVLHGVQDPRETWGRLVTRAGHARTPEQIVVHIYELGRTRGELDKGLQELSAAEGAWNKDKPNLFRSRGNAAKRLQRQIQGAIEELERVSPQIKDLMSQTEELMSSLDRGCRKHWNDKLALTAQTAERRPSPVSSIASVSPVSLEFSADTPLLGTSPTQPMARSAVAIHRERSSPTRAEQPPRRPDNARHVGGAERFYPSPAMEPTIPEGSGARIRR